MAKIVIADDSRTQRSTIAMALERRGHQVLQSGDGLEALHLVHEQNPDLLVSDIVMPELTGYQLCRLLKNDPATADLPIVLLTTLDHQGHRFWGKEAGADSYVLKGADAKPLEDEVARLLSERHRRPPSERVAASSLPPARHSAQARLTDLLDRLLFEATISNRMRESARLGGGLAAVANRLCEFFYELIDYDLCAIGVRGATGPQLLIRMSAPVAAETLEAAKERFVRERLLTLADGESLSVNILTPELLGREGEAQPLSMLSARFPQSQQGGLAVFTANRAPQTDESRATLRLAAAELEPIITTTLQADALEKLKADFTAMIVHDLRAPLTAIMSAAAIVEDGLVGAVNDEQKSWLAKISGQSRTLLDLINDFLDLSKIEAGRLDLQLEAIDLASAAAVLDDYAILLREKKIALSLRLGELGCRVEADRARLGQVFANLLSNAIKFTPEGGAIEIGAAPHGADEVRIWVKDTGIGIPADEIKGLFEKYRQAQSGRMSKQKGTGLGLAICKMIVESHGGKIWIDSREREGSTFSFTLRRAK